MIGLMPSPAVLPGVCASQLAVAEWSKLTPEQKKAWKEAYFAAHPELLATSNPDDEAHEGTLCS